VYTSGKFGFGYPAIAVGSSQTSHYSHYPAGTFDQGISPISPISLFAPSALLQDNTRIRNPQRQDDRTKLGHDWRRLATMVGDDWLHLETFGAFRRRHI
jgi:hypothetical protein